MKRNLTLIATAILAASLSAALLSGCASTKIKHISPAEFMARAQTIDSSASSERFVGTGTNRIYYEYTNYITLAGFLKLSDKPTTTLYWTELDQIPASFIQQLSIDKTKYYQHLEQYKTNAANPK